MSRHQSYDDMLDQLDRFIAELDAKMSLVESGKGHPPEKPRTDADDEPLEDELDTKPFIFMRMPARSLMVVF